ncbi:hypothetical protein PAXRUDRAFT_826957 [Paxillus rubicundulus Ve08.2h10]|uniref:Uncharacterized protein n=1 Tax=Paxillus rubicundulus Ve08.2h10 TaxID=930991 RepID=A0A0D0DDT2_9AGAM|nr:hypothetical protein PAXRUDRAFT_826957 [Paxillus rubicundulus Ve08.2h10]
MVVPSSRQTLVHAAVRLAGIADSANRATPDCLVPRSEGNQHQEPPAGSLKP